MIPPVTAATYRFIKEETGKWYIELPGYPGPKADLQMVEGADTMLDVIAQGSHSVSLQLAEGPFEGADVLKLIEVYPENIGGGTYLLEVYDGETINQQMWLCGVTVYVFNKLPPLIYLKKGL